MKRLLFGLFSRRFNDEQAYVLKIVVSMIPIGIVGFALKDHIDALLDSPRILTVVGAMLLLTSVLLAFAYYARPRLKETISCRDAFIIGIAQAVAAMPGLSRSGSTIATGLLLGNRKEAVARFSFLMVLIPHSRRSPSRCQGHGCRKLRSSPGHRLGTAGHRLHGIVRCGMCRMPLDDFAGETRQARVVRLLLRGRGPALYFWNMF